jgi:hypothetical protein
VTPLLQRTVAEAEKLPQEVQDAIAARVLAEIEDERQWAALLAVTTDAQWEQMIKEAEQEIAARRVYLLDVAFPSGESRL